MVGEFLGFFQGAWTNFSDASQLDKILAIFSLSGISITGFLLGGRANKQRLRRAEKRVGELQKEAERLEQQAEAKVAAATKARDDFDPASWLAAADRYRRAGNEQRAIDSLDAGYRRVRAGLSEVIQYLAEHHGSLIVGADWEGNLADAKRLARLSHLLDPANSGAKAFFEELSVVDERILEELEPVGSQFLPTDPVLASGMILELLALQDKFFASGDYQICIALMRRADLICRRDPAFPDEMHLEVLHSLTQSLQHTGPPKSALDAVRRLLPLLEKDGGPKDPETLAARYLEASILYDLGEYKLALDAIRSLLPLQEKINGPEHRDTLVSRHFEATVLSDLGEYRESRNAVSKLLLLQAKIGGPQDPLMHAVRYLDASTLQELGEYEQALDIVRSLLVRLNEMPGSEEIEKLTARHLEATILRDQGEHQRALNAVRSLLPLFEEINGPEHRYTLMSRHLEAAILSDLGDYGQALDAVHNLRPLMEKVCGLEHPYTYRLRYFEAKILFNLGETAEALARAKAVLSCQQDKLGPKHRHVKESAKLVDEICNSAR